MTPPEVHTSVIRCLESACSTIDRCFSPARIRMPATTKFRAVAIPETSRPTPRSSSGWGSRNRGIAVNMMSPAAIRIIRPSKSAEKYSALLRPKWWRSSPGRAAAFSATRATTAATMFTVDSRASESRPTESVRK